MKKNHSMDLTHGSVMKRLITFALPIMLANLLQQLYHAADVVVVGNFAQEPTAALAAVGSTASITTLLLHLFLGLSVGVNVVCAQLYGAGEHGPLRRAMHTGILLAAVSGVGIAAVGYVLTPTLLKLVGSPPDVIGQATEYMRIIFLGQPGALVYNFGAGILRSHGDTKRPMYILSATGLLNVLLNLLFVIAFRMDAAGVALATILANYVSAAVILFLLFRPDGEFQMSLSQLRLNVKEAFRIVKIGVPCGVNGILFSLSNVIIMSSLNSLGSVVLAANSAAANVDAILFQVISAFYTACVSFAGQNFGAKNLKRIDRLLVRSVLLSGGILLIANAFLFLFPSFFMKLFTPDPVLIETGIPRLFIMGGGYMIYILSEMCCGCIRGMGRSVLPTVISVFFICVPRIIWIFLFFPLNPTYEFLLWCYPLSWALSSLAQFVCYLVCRRKEARRFAAEAALS